MMPSLLVARALAADPAYLLLPGVWYEAPPADPGLVKVGRDHLEFTGFAAVRLPGSVLAADGLRITATIDPVVGDVRSESWVSLMLTSATPSLGWVTESTTMFGLLVRSNGQVDIFSNGVECPPVWAGAPPARAGAVGLVLRSVDGRVHVDGAVEGSTFSALLPVGTELPLQVFVQVGAHYHEAPSPSTVDGLRVDPLR